MQSKKEAMELGQITRLFQTEILSSEECGIYISNIEIFNIAKEMGFDVTLTSNEFIVGELFKICSKENRLKELYERVLAVFEERQAKYKSLTSIYPGAAEAIESWSTRADKTVDKLKTNIKELTNG